MTALGVVLIVIGVLFILVGLVAAVRKVVLQAAKPQAAGLGAFDPEKWEKFIKAVTEFVKAAPEWLLLVLVGAGLVAWGGSGP
jgi:predicted RND superfamily exporter protein